MNLFICLRIISHARNLCLSLNIEHISGHICHTIVYIYIYIYIYIYTTIYILYIV